MRVAIEAASLALSSGGLARYTSELSLALARCFPDDEFFLLSDQPFDGTGGPAVQRGVEIAGGEGAEVTLGNLGRGGHERVGVYA